VISIELRVGDILIGADGVRKTFRQIDQRYEPEFLVCNLTTEIDYTG